ncbi:HAMP domain-containing protein [Candidatus Bipolaricaulota bacterium]|nr:HAMP domain-containing protein [Candidatus Bipolaricaulota bacterium]
MAPLMWAGLAALVISVLLALLVSRSVAAPLRRVAGAAESIAHGKTGTRAPVSGPAEAQALARSFNTMADQVEAEINTRSKSEISSHDIGEIVMEKLRDVDEIAYVRFASVYRKFKDKEEFLEEMKKLLE